MKLENGSWFFILTLFKNCWIDILISETIISFTSPLNRIRFFFGFNSSPVFIRSCNAKFVTLEMETLQIVLICNSRLSNSEIFLPYDRRRNHLYLMRYKALLRMLNPNFKDANMYK